MSKAFCKIDIIFKSTKLPLVAKPRPYHLSPPYQTTNYHGTLGWHHVTCPGPLKGRKRAGELIERQHDNASEVQVQQQADGDMQHAPFICERPPLVTFVSSCLQNVNHEAWKGGQACKVQIIEFVHCTSWCKWLLLSGTEVWKFCVFVQRWSGEDRSKQEGGRNFGWQKEGLEIGKKVFYCPSHLVWLALWWTRTRKLHFPRSDP